MSDYSPFSAPLAQTTSRELKEFCSISEGWHVEYKSLPIPPKVLAKSLSSFANQYGGWLVLGVVEDKRDLTAQEFPGLTQQQVSNVVQNLRDASRDCVNPEVYYEHRVFDGPIEEIALPAGKSVVVVHVPQGPEPPYVHADARIYRRVGDSSAPKPETDQSILDRLSLRAQQSRERLEDMVTRVPMTSKGEEDNCYLHITITSDPYEISGHRFRGTFEEFSEIMQRDPIPFNNIFTRAGGFVARQTTSNDPYNRLLTWEFDRNCHSFITLPINTLSIQGETLASYNTGTSFAGLFEPIVAIILPFAGPQPSVQSDLGHWHKATRASCESRCLWPFLFQELYRKRLAQGTVFGHAFLSSTRSEVRRSRYPRRRRFCTARHGSEEF